MKLLKISEGSGYFLDAKGSYALIDRLTKEDLLRLVEQVLSDAAASFDIYDEQALKNQAHQVIYKSVHAKMKSLQGRQKEFVDQAARLHLEAYEKYRKQGGD